MREFFNRKTGKSDSNREKYNIARRLLVAFSKDLKKEDTVFMH
jgi:hypothetical protein